MKIEGFSNSGSLNPEFSGKPAVKKGRFSWLKSATKGNSFFDLEKQNF
jgi:hypothetical protein